MEKYKLLKELPNAKAGEIFVIAVDIGALVREHNQYDVLYSKEQLQENDILNPDKGWFKEVKDNGYWYFEDDGVLAHVEQPDDIKTVHRKEIGNYFKTKEEAKAAVKKLEAWKRLKDAGFKFINWYGGSETITYEFKDKPEGYIPVKECADLDLLFGGEE